MPSSVVVSNLNIESVSVFPAKADTVLIVNADGMLSGTIAFQCFQPVRRRRRHVSKLFRAIDLNQPSQRHSRNLLKSPDALLMEDRLRVFIAKRADQTTIILRIALYVKRQEIRSRLNLFFGSSAIASFSGVSFSHSTRRKPICVNSSRQRIFNVLPIVLPIGRSQSYSGYYCCVPSDVEHISPRPIK